MDEKTKPAREDKNWLSVMVFDLRWEGAPPDGLFEQVSSMIESAFAIDNSRDD